MKKKALKVSILMIIYLSLFLLCLTASLALAEKVVVIPLNSGKSSGKFVDGNNPNDAVYTEGNVGIGTTTPDTRLHVNGLAPQIKIEQGDNMGMYFWQNGGSHAGIDINRDPQTYLFDDSNLTHARISFAGEDSDSYLMFYTANTNNVHATEQMRIDKDGNLGVGTMNPLSKLAVSGLPTSPPDVSGNAGVVCVTNDGNFWLDNDGTADCL
ncbi:MAG: hypothetical protein GY702_17900 [Desulfobulbaceae bacterium]|nr:hypothetical protein [Desulfobulbaceae bacterium]